MTAPLRATDELFDVIIAPTWFSLLPTDVRKQAYQGKAITVGNEIWCACLGCSRLIKANGWFGGVHLCR